MKLYVLTRSAYGPAWTPEANRRRLEVTAAVTARLMARQADVDWTWLVLVDTRDPLREQREAVFRAAAPRCVAIPWTPPATPKQAPWDRRAAQKVLVDAIAYEAYRAPWPVEHDDVTVQVRLDDDDGLAPRVLARYRANARARREILMFPRGLRVYKGRYSVVRHERNAMHALVTPPGDTLCVYDYGHVKCDRVAPVRMLGPELGWLWVRHRDTISGWRKAEQPLTAAIRRTFPIDWRVIG